MARIRCDKCQLVVINGLACHETGCPNSKKEWDESRQQWIDPDEEEVEEFFPEGPAQ